MALLLSRDPAPASQGGTQGDVQGTSQRRRVPPCPMMPRSPGRREVANTERGVHVRITSDDPSTAKRIAANCGTHQEWMKQAGPRHKLMCPAAVGGAQVKVTALDNGAELEITSDKPETVKEIQSRAARLAGAPQPKPR